MNQIHGYLNSVNALLGGCIISTEPPKFEVEDGEIVSMPYWAAVSFLQIGLTRNWKPIMRCQCPIGRLYRFYVYSDELRVVPHQGVNALLGGCIVSTKEFQKWITHTVLCQCPIGRLYRFYGQLSQPAEIQRFKHVF